MRCKVTLVEQRVGDSGSPGEQGVEEGSPIEPAGFRRCAERAVHGAGRKPWEIGEDALGRLPLTPRWYKNHLVKNADSPSPGILSLQIWVRIQEWAFITHTRN